MRAAAFCLIALFCIGLKPMFACSCGDPGSPKPEMEAADVVFSGVVTQVSPSANAYPKTYTFQVYNSWKGMAPEISTVTLADAGRSCDFGFIEDTSYLVYANGNPLDSLLTAHLCTRTKELRDAKEDLSELGYGTKHSGASNFPGWQYIFVPIVAALVSYIVLSQAQKRSRRNSKTK